MSLIEDSGLVAQVHAWHLEGLGSREVATRITKRTGQSIGASGVRYWLQRHPPPAPAASLRVEEQRRVATDPALRDRAIAELEETIALGQAAVRGELRVRSSVALARIYEATIWACLELLDLSVDAQRVTGTAAR